MNKMSEISHKAERLASAVYLLTNFFNEQEPLKWKLRSLSSDLVSQSNLIKDNYSTNNIHGLKASTLSREIKSLLNISKTAGLISEANHAVIIPELNKYAELIAVSEHISGVLDEVAEPQPENRLASVEARQRTIEVRDKISNPVENRREYLPEVSSVESLNRSEETRESKDIRTNQEKKPQLKGFGAVSVKRNTRQSAIISLLKRKKEIMIKDVSPLISNCSEKTIQRELSAMVKAGILNKTGEKRWSRYSLA